MRERERASERARENERARERERGGQAECHIHLVFGVKSGSQQTEMSGWPELFVQLPKPPTEIGDGCLATAPHPGWSILSLFYQLSPHGLHQEQQNVLPPGTTQSISNLIYTH